MFARLGAPFGGLINWITDRVIIRKLAKQINWISDKRIFPKFGYRENQKETRINRMELQQNSESCLFLPDTFTHFFEPDVETAALKVLVACGIKVKILPVFGAGRTLLSKGFIKSAQNHAVHLLTEIRRADPTGKLAVIGLEPSEIYTLRDEIQDLLPGNRDEIEALMARSWLIDEYLVRPSLDNQVMRVASALIESGQKTKISLHGHCYQKAQPPHMDGFPIGVSASAELLRAVGYEVEVLNTGCCGMAGAFGYEAEHYNVSMQVGELMLFPEIRNAAAAGQSSVVAVGTSCRSQIEDGTGVKARHSIVMVSQKLIG
jgi:Fe-S oxidoreductase